MQFIGPIIFLALLIGVVFSPEIKAWLMARDERSATKKARGK